MPGTHRRHAAAYFSLHSSPYLWYTERKCYRGGCGQIKNGRENGDVTTCASGAEAPACGRLRHCMRRSMRRLQPRARRRRTTCPRLPRKGVAAGQQRFAMRSGACGSRSRERARVNGVMGSGCFVACSRQTAVAASGDRGRDAWGAVRVRKPGRALGLPWWYV